MWKSMKVGLRKSERGAETIFLICIVLSNTAIFFNWYLGQPKKLSSFTKDSIEIPVKQGAVNGHLDRMILNDETQLELEGWAFDSRNSQLVDEILVRYNERVIYKAKTNKARPDLVNVFGDVASMGGFSFALPLDLFQNEKIDNLKLRLFAVSDGVASELKYPKGFK